MSSQRISTPYAAVETLLVRIGTWIRAFVGVVARKQTYANIAYLLLAFPLGLGYVMLFMTAAAVPFGIGLALADIATAGPIELLIVGLPIVIVFLCLGVPIILVALFASIELVAVERLLADRLLGTTIQTSEPARTARERAKRLVADRGTWKGVTYLISKFVLGTASFLIVVFGFTFTYALIATPLHYQNALVGIHINEPVEIIPALSYSHDDWTLDLVSSTTISLADGELLSMYVDSIPAALVVSAIGICVGLLVCHLCNGVAWLYARYTERLLGGTQPSIFTEPPTE